MDDLKNLISERIETRSYDPTPTCFDIIVSSMRNAEKKDILSFLDDIENAPTLERDDFWAFCETLVSPVESALSVPKDEHVALVSENGFYITNEKQLENIIKNKIEKLSDQSQIPALIRHHERKTGKKTSEVYKAVYISRQLYSSFSSKEKTGYSKRNLIRLAIGFEMTLSEAEEFLAAGGYTFNNTKFDIIITTCLEKRYYNVDEIDYILNSYKLQTFNPDKGKENEKE